MAAASIQRTLAALAVAACLFGPATAENLFKVPGTDYYISLNAAQPLNTADSQPLLAAIAVWLSANFPLPVSLDHPRIQFVSAAEMIAPLNKYPLQRNDLSASEISSDIVSLYSNESKTIFLLNGWEGKTPAELSILVHEMVHHLQNVGQLKFACPEEREELAYKAQESWLHLFGHDLEHDFQMDPFTILVKSKCF